MALSNCRSNGQGLRLRYRLEVFGFASDDRCASGASALFIAAGRRRSVTVHAAAERRSSTEWTVRRLADAVVFRCERCMDVGRLAIVLSLCCAVWTSLHT